MQAQLFHGDCVHSVQAGDRSLHPHACSTCSSQWTAAEKDAYNTGANLHAFCPAAVQHPTRGAAVPHTIQV